MRYGKMKRLFSVLRSFNLRIINIETSLYYKNSKPFTLIEISVAKSQGQRNKFEPGRQLQDRYSKEVQEEKSRGR